jgi:hypothetical protein
VTDLSQYQWVTLKNRRLNFGLISGRVVMVFGGAKPMGSITVDRLDAVVHGPEGVSADAKTLRVGALGIILIVDHLATMAKYADSGRQLHNRIFKLFNGSAYAREMIAATCRSAFNQTSAGGDAGYYIASANRQLQSWSTDTVDVEVQLVA